MTDIEAAKLDPHSIFKHPRDVLKDQTLTKEQKIDILRRWAYDEREMEVAEEENMPSPHPEKDHILDEILDCLLKLGVSSDQPEHPPTKQG